MKNNKVHEKFLYELWKNQNFTSDLGTKDGQSIDIIDSGVENSELGGPDFKGARIKIGNITYMGDVEIDSFYSDWRAHGHNLNKKYNKVVLHAVLNNDSKHAYVYTQDGRKVPSISLKDFLKEDLNNDIQKAILSERKNRINKMPCIEANTTLSEKEKLNFLFDLGLKRFKTKCEKMTERLKEIAYIKELKVKEPVMKYELDENFYGREFTKDDFHDPEIWQQLIFENIFEALGYSKNKDIMRNMAKAVEIEFLTNFKGQEDFILQAESALFNIGGLMPEVENLPDEETSEYTRDLAEKWGAIKASYDGTIFHAAQWHFFKLRPQNFPTIRIAGGVRLVNKMLNEKLIEQIISSIEENEKPGRLASILRSCFIVKGEGFWHNHYVFDQPAKVPINYFIGASRADEIIINIILPILSVYFELFGRNDLAKRVVQLYLNYYQKSENNLVNEVSSTLKLNDAWKRSVLYQGMIELFRNYCSRDKCMECSIGKKVFN